MSDPVTCATCSQPRVATCPCGCGLSEPTPVCPRCDPAGAAKRAVTHGTPACVGYVTRRLNPYAVR